MVFYEPHTASALDNQVIALGREVGSVGVFSPIVEGDRLSFSRSREGKDGVFVDEETGSSWNLAGTRHVGTFGGRPAGSPSPLPQRAVVFVGLVQARRVYLSALSRGAALSQGARSRSPPSQSSPPMGKTQSGPHPNPLPQGEGVLEGCSRGPAWLREMSVWRCCHSAFGKASLISSNVNLWDTILWKGILSRFFTR